MIAWIASYPRSGNTWFMTVLGRLDSVQKAEVYDVPMPERADFVSVLANATDLHALKTHELPSGDALPAVYLVRDGRDAMVSHAHYILWTGRQISPGADPARFEEVLRRLVTSRMPGFAPWSDHVLRWLRRPVRPVIVRYEDLVRNPVEVVRTAWQTLTGRPLGDTPVSLPTFPELQARAPWFYRKGQVGAWREEMSDELHDLFWRHHGAGMRALQYGDDPSRPPAATRWLGRLWRKG